MELLILFGLLLLLCTLYLTQRYSQAGKEKKIQHSQAPTLYQFSWQKCIKSSNFHLISVTCKWVIIHREWICNDRWKSRQPKQVIVNYPNWVTSKPFLSTIQMHHLEFNLSPFSHIGKWTWIRTNFCKIRKLFWAHVYLSTEFWFHMSQN